MPTRFQETRRASVYIHRSLRNKKSTTIPPVSSTQRSGAVPALLTDHEGVSFPIINVLYMRS
jgi:hypothetical protein